MSRQSRLDRLEQELTPTAAVGRWLAEAHAFGSAGAYLAWLIDQPLSGSPFIRIPNELTLAVAARRRGQPDAAVRSAARTAVREATFLIALVFELNVATAAHLREEDLEQGFLALTAYVADLEDEHSTAAPAADHASDRGALGRLADDVPGAVARHLVGLLVAREARRDLERRYLARAVTLFPELAAEEDRLVEGAISLAGGVRELWLDHASAVKRRRGRSTDTVLRFATLQARARAKAPVEAEARLTAARITAFGLLGEDASANRLATRLLRRSLHGPPVGD